MKHDYACLPNKARRWFDPTDNWLFRFSSTTCTEVCTAARYSPVLCKLQYHTHSWSMLLPCLPAIGFAVMHAKKPRITSLVRHSIIRQQRNGICRGWVHNCGSHRPITPNEGLEQPPPPSPRACI